MARSKLTTLKAWSSIPAEIRRAIAGVSTSDLGSRGGPERLSIREYVHHLVEANLVASNIVLAALGQPGCRYDWSWVMPDSGWMKRLGYNRAPIEPALELLETLVAHVTGIVRSAPGGMRRHVRLLDAPGARLRRRTVEEVLEDECEHARHHLRDIAEARKMHGRRRKGVGSKSPNGVDA